MKSNLGILRDQWKNIKLLLAEKHDAKSLVLKIAKEEKVDDKIIEEALVIIDEVMFND